MKQYLAIPALAATIATSVVLAGPADAATPHTVKLTMTCSHVGTHTSTRWQCVVRYSGSAKFPKVVAHKRHSYKAYVTVEPAAGTALTHVKARASYSHGDKHNFGGQPTDHLPVYRGAHHHDVLTKLTLSANVVTYQVG